MKRIHRGTNRICMGLGAVADQQDFTEERAAFDAWLDKVSDLMNSVPSDHWISVVDCHN